MRTSGMEQFWEHQKENKTRLPAKVNLINPIDPLFEEGLEDLLTRLARVGIEQFVVPDHIVSRSASALSKITKYTGLVVASSEWVGGTKLATVPTAVLLPSEDASASRMLETAGKFSTNAEVTVVIVGRPGRKFRGRRLDQTVSTHPPYSEVALEHFESTMESTA